MLQVIRRILSLTPDKEMKEAWLKAKANKGLRQKVMISAGRWSRDLAYR
jgi:hypothetical protein